MSQKPNFQRRGRELVPGQTAELTVFDIETGDSSVIFTSSEVIEAPNWTPDGKDLIFNAGGQSLADRRRWQGMSLNLIDTAPLADLNNDHVVSPDGSTALYLSSDGGHLYSQCRLPAARRRRVSNQHEQPFHYYLHGISPDGLRACLCRCRGWAGQSAHQPLHHSSFACGPDRRLSDIDKPNDGPDYSADGRWIYFNSERASATPGHAQIFRMATRWIRRRAIDP
jgi:TolB protein